MSRCYPPLPPAVTPAAATGAAASERSSASAFGNYHSFVLVLVGDDALVVDVEDRDGFELRRNTAGLRRFLRRVGVEHRLDDGVLRRSQTVVQRKVTASTAFVRLSDTQERHRTHKHTLFDRG